MPEQKQTYMQQIDGWLDAMRNDESVDWDEMKRRIKAKLLESYRNGQAASPARQSFSKQKQTPK